MQMSTSYSKQQEKSSSKCKKHFLQKIKLSISENLAKPLPKRVCITGATSGLGLSLAKAFSQHGSYLLLIGRDEEKLLSLRQQLPRAQVLAQDLLETNQQTLDTIVKFNPDCVINNAGIGYYGPLHHLSSSEVDSILTLKVKVTTRIIHAITSHWIEHGVKGTFLNVSSAASLLPYPYFATYSAANAYLKQFSIGIHGELSPLGIASLVFCPGTINTRFAKLASHQYYTETPPMALSVEKCTKAILKQIRKQKPLVIYDWRYYIMIGTLKWLPLKMQHAILKKTLTKRIH